VGRVYHRLEQFGRRGWSVIVRLEADGRAVFVAEKVLLNWVREDLKLPQHLDNASMGRPGGASETFSIVDGLKEDIIQRMKIELEKATEQVKLGE
jgi:hypothetical protein